jgi:hypothetical protein
MSGRPSSSQDPNGSDTASASNEKKHPSEYLEFASLPGTIPGTRLQPLKSVAIEEPESPLHNPTQSNDALYDGLSRAIPNLRRLSIEARAATKAEHRMGFIAGCRTYPRAIVWSALLSLTIVVSLLLELHSSMGDYVRSYRVASI